MKRTTGLLLALGLIVYAGATWLGYHYVWQSIFPGELRENRLVVEDDGGILGSERAAFISLYHKELLSDHDIDYRTVVLSDEVDRDIDAFSYKYFTGHNVGELSRSGRGLLLVIDTHNDLVRLEVSQALEGVYTDSFVSYIQHRQMIPFFRSGRVADGILASTELMVSRAQQAIRGQAFAPPMDARTAGAGAANPARIGTGEDSSFREGADVEAASNDPRAVLAAYREAMDQRNGNPELSIYTEETRVFLGQWTVTPAQMDNEAKNLAACPTGVLKVRAEYAVLRFPVSLRQCPPYFFRVEHGEWRLDLTMMNKAIRFNHRNQWHFYTQYHLENEPYAFAFSDWRFDRHGFPRKAEEVVTETEQD